MRWLGSVLYWSMVALLLVFLFNLTAHSQAPKDYLTDVEGLSRMYKDATRSFMPQQPGVHVPELLVPIGPDGKLGAITIGEPERDNYGSMHVVTSIPNDSSAIIHSHPLSQDPRPSEEDYKTAMKIGKPNFVMTFNKIYVAMPSGNVKHPIEVADISMRHGKLQLKWK